MLRSIWTFAVSLMVGAILVASPAASEPQYSRAPGAILIDHDDNNARVCCKRGHNDWWSSERECRRAGGHQTHDRECRRDGSTDDWGYNDRKWNERTCCQRNERLGYRIFWSTVGQCARSGGQGATNKTCRKYGGFHPYHRGYQGDGGGYGYDGGNDWQGGDANERVCCSRDGQVWWSNRAECRRASGQTATNKSCRRN